jgi:FtsH-binding integral membrane protein
MNNFQTDNDILDFTQDSAKDMPKAFVANVMTYMAHALLISGLLAYLFGTNEALIQLQFNLQTGGRTIFGWVIMFAPLAMVFLISAGMQRLSFQSLILAFVVFASLMGMSLGSIFLGYSMSSIALTFGVTAGTFGAMAIIGYTTKADLTKMGSFLYMALIGIIIASLANWFFQSGTLDYIISIAGVIIFTGLTAYDMQKIKRMVCR